MPRFGAINYDLFVTHDLNSADFDDDNRVDPQDANVLMTNWGQQVPLGPPGDLNSDRWVDAADFAILQEYGLRQSRDSTEFPLSRGLAPFG